MRYWLVTHWPHLTNENPDELPSGVWLQERAMDIGQFVSEGDMVVIYQSNGGPAMLRRLVPGAPPERFGRHPGLGGVAVICQAIEPVTEDSTIPEEEFAGDRIYRWNWHARTSLVTAAGRLTRDDLNIILGYDEGNYFRGFNHGRGIKELTEEEFDNIVRQFTKNCPKEKEIKTAKNTAQDHYPGHSNGSEGEDHHKLKEFVCKFPQEVFGEGGWVHAEVEFPFPGTGDRADVLLVDKFKRPVLVEVELHVDDLLHPGILQAVKYKHMYAVICKREFGEVRGVLIAHAISDRVKSICSRYDIEPIIVEPDKLKGFAN
jgi:hypothetical protein